jgi:hypothetical protein
MRRLPVIILAVLVSCLAAAAEDSSTKAAFQQAVSEYQKADKPTPEAAENVIKLAIALDQLPPIPEEARRHFVRGSALVKDVKSAEDYGGVIEEFSQAVKMAPWMPQALFNLALAYEAKGDYAKAISNMKLYQLFKLSESEARGAKDKTYALEARMDKVTREKEEREVQAQETANALDRSLVGTWYLKQSKDLAHKDGDPIIVIRRSSGVYSATLPRENWTQDLGANGNSRLTEELTEEISDVRIQARNVKFQTKTLIANYLNGRYLSTTSIVHKYDVELGAHAKTLNGTAESDLGPRRSETERCELFRSE